MKHVEIEPINGKRRCACGWIEETQMRRYGRWRVLANSGSRAVRTVQNQACKCAYLPEGHQIAKSSQATNAESLPGGARCVRIQSIG